MSDETSSKKGIIAAVLIVAAVGFGYAQMQKTALTPEINNGVTGDFGPGEDRSQDFTRAARAAGITSAQIKQIEKVRESGDWREMRTQMQDILTTPQREKLAEQFRDNRANQRAARDSKMRSILGSADFQRYQEKRDERFRGRGGRGGPGGPGAPGGNRRGGGGGERRGPGGTN